MKLWTCVVSKPVEIEVHKAPHFKALINDGPCTVGTKVIRIQNQNGRMCPNFIFWYSYLLYFNIERHIIKYNLDFQMKNDFKMA